MDKLSEIFVYLQENNAINYFSIPTLISTLIFTFGFQEYLWKVKNGKKEGAKAFISTDKYLWFSRMSDFLILCCFNLIVFIGFKLSGECTFLRSLTVMFFFFYALLLLAEITFLHHFKLSHLLKKFQRQ